MKTIETIKQSYIHGDDAKKTNYTFKLIYAVGIIMVVAGHCNNGGFSMFYEWFPIYSFHLALFMFSSRIFL